jgi:peptide/nickel transport system substrate-binding protein
MHHGRWWGPRPEWRFVTLKFLPNAGARSAALLSGAVDVIDVPSPNDLPRLPRDANFSVYAHQGMRTIYLAPDQTSDTPSAFITDVNGQPLPRNPMRDLRVRRALSIAINRDAWQNG